MNKKNLRSILPPLISLALSVCAGFGLMYLYRITKYLPFYQLGLLLLLPSAVHVSLFVLKIPIRSKKKCDPAEADTPAKAPEALKHGKLSAVLSAIAKPFSLLWRMIKGSYNENRAQKILNAVSLLLAGACFALVEYYFFISIKAATSLYNLNYFIAVILIAFFLVLIILDKWLLHSESDNEYAEALRYNVRSTLALARLALILILPSMFIKLLGFYELQKYLCIAITVIFYWTTLFLIISFIARAIRHELKSAPDLRIPTPFSGGSGKDMGIISYLEENTGITMRGLWSVKLIKKLIAPSLIAVLALFWISTGIVEIGAGQQGALYRMGALRNEPLEPGLHLTFPWPFDKTVIYNTDEVSTITIGYRSDTSSDNVWTQTHGSEEYELLLGGGEELVSINLCIEYKISDLNDYLINCANPEAILEASAYELVADKTIITDLDTLLSVDREAFASDFAVDLTEKIKAHSTGLEIVSVVLESIHPPLGIADIYQQLVSAEINAATRIMSAKAYAAVQLHNAETTRSTTVSMAMSDKLSRIASAEAEVAEFMASVSADNQYSEAYRYYKYLNALSQAYGNADLIIVGSDVDDSRIYLGKFNN